jgi:hypothetical protein
VPPSCVPFTTSPAHTHAERDRQVKASNTGRGRDVETREHENTTRPNTQDTSERPSQDEHTVGLSLHPRHPSLKCAPTVVKQSSPEQEASVFIPILSTCMYHPQHTLYVSVCEYRHSMYYPTPIGFARLPLRYT